MIEIRVSGFECDPGEIEVGAAGSYGMQQLHFAFSAEWEGLNKRTTWNTDSGPVSVMLDENEVAEVPAEATATAGRRYFSIDGFAEGRQHISVRVTYKVFETVAPGGANSVPPTDSEMTQALAIMQEIRDLKTPEVTAGQTKTVAAAQPARVVNTGTETKAVFDFEIPRGESGVYVGSDEPGEDVQLWIVPEGENEIDEGLDVLESAVKRVENATVFAPKIGADGTWLVYDSVKGAYVDTGVSARGTQGEKGEKGEDGTPGQDGKDGKDAVLFVQADEPTDAKVGDLWFDTDEEVTEPSGGASSWNDLTDKPFSEVYGDTVTWDGDATGKYCVGEVFFKICDTAPSVEELATGGTLVAGADTLDFTANEVVNEDGVVNIAQSVLIVTDAGATASGLPQGTYFISHPGVGFVSRLTINGYNGFPMVQKIDEKFLPVVSSVVMKSSTADSTKQFKITVDDSGTLTVTEIV